MTTFELYNILGLDKDNNPSFDDIKKAYKINAMKYHPDKNKEEGAEKKFKDISRAYDILSDGNKKAAYDRFGDEYLNNPNNTSGRNEHHHHDIFEHLFKRNNGMFGGNPFFDFDDERQETKCRDMQRTYNVTLDEVYNGINKSFSINISKNCHDCITMCQNCKGTGMIKHVRNMGLLHQIFSAPCDRCQDGFTLKMNKSCSKCNGTGKYNTESNIKLNLPKGISSGHKTLFKGLGEQPKNPNQKPGDLIFIINITEHNNFKREGNNLNYTCNINFIDSIIGKEIEIPHFNGNTIRTNINNWGVVHPGKKYMIQQKGMPIINTQSYGNLFIDFNIKYPKIKKNEHIDELEKLLRKVFED